MSYFKAEMHQIRFWASVPVIIEDDTAPISKTTVPQLPLHNPIKYAVPPLWRVELDGDVVTR